MIDPLALTWPLLRPALFRLDPERAHDLTIAAMSRWSRLCASRPLAPALTRRADLEVVRDGLRFPNPLGLAAGLDKNAEAAPAWQRIGFGFAEVGTVTAHGQPGNEQPRLFRLVPDEAIINRFGFNNQGAEVVAKRLRALRDADRLSMPLGINIGKSKVTPAEEAAEDYCASFAALGLLADYLVLNISSPNTPGLRDLQRAEEVARIVEAVQALNQLGPQKPIYVKLAPDLELDAALAACRASLEAGCDGFVISNTTIDFAGLRSSTDGMSGGLSGRPLFERSTEMLRAVRAELGDGPTLIGVGGVFGADEAKAKLAAGANLVQVYTGLIYRGPGMVREILGGF